MGIMAFIEWCITFVVAFIIFMTGRVFLFPDPDLSPEKLPPQQIMKPIWRTFLTICLIIFKWIVVAITVIWVFWHILKMIPIIGQIIIAVVPPFRQLERYYIFELWDNLAKNILTLNLFGIIRSLFKFFNKAGNKVFKKITGVSIKQRQQQVVQNITDLGKIDVNINTGGNNNTATSTATASNTPKVSSTTQSGQILQSGQTTKKRQEKVVQTSNPTPIEQKPVDEDNIDDKKYLGPDAEEESKFTAEQHKAVEDKLQLCISENTIPINNTMTLKEKLQTRVLNNNVSIKCKAESVADYTKMKDYNL